MERRLSAILAADVAGYSRLMEQNEVATFERLKACHRELFEPEIEKHHGRIFKLMGDGLLVEFGSAVDAIECAIALQRALAKRNEGVDAARRIDFRIGINLGDVIVEGEDRHGDGVNIAARLEQASEPGAILVSGTVYDYVKNKVDVTFDELGMQTLKNLAEPVRLYRVAEVPRVPAFSFKTGSDKPSIAVLPFSNMSGDPGQQYFSDGITEDIITELTRFRQLFVIARNSSFVFRDRPIDMREIGRRLGVQYVVEGSVRRSGGRIRVTAQLIDSTTGNHIWAERYDRDAEDIFAVQDDVTQSIAAALFGQVEDAGAKVAKRKRPDTLAAYDYLLQAIDHQQRGTEEYLRSARELLEKVIEIDPELAIAHAWLALVDQGEWDYHGGKELINSALEHAERAVELDEDDARCHVVLGYVYLYANRIEKAEFHQRRALALNPNDAHIVAHMGLVEAYLGNATDAVSWLEKALRLNPFPPYWYRSFLGMAHYVARDYAQVVATLNSSGHHLPWDLMYLAASYACLGRIHDARQKLSEYLALSRQGSMLEYAESEPFKHSSDLEHLLGGLRRAGL